MQVNNNKYLYEGLNRSDKNSVLLWETAGKKIIEANLTADQINQLFTNVEQGATAAGGNRTLVGQGKDVASAVNKAWEDLKTKVQNSGPIQKVDAMYDQAAEKLKQATGGDQGVMQYVQKYRDFAQKHPIAQSLIYSALIAAAGISGAGLGGAAALGLFKMVDKLLQGEKFSSATYQGAKTGAMAYGASKLGDYIKGKMSGDAQAPTVQRPKSMDNSYDNYITKNPNTTTSPDEFARRGNSGWNQASQVPTNPDGSPMTLDQINAIKAAHLRAGGNVAKESIQLSQKQIRVIFEHVNDTLLLEGIMDFAKGAIGKGLDWAQTKGKNLTTKITADKLQQAWKAAGSPTDSEEVAKILQSAGVDAGVIEKAFTDVGVQRGSAQSNTVNVDEINKFLSTLEITDLKNIQKLVNDALTKSA